MSNKDDLTTKELTEVVDALGSAVKAQQPLNQAVCDRMTHIEAVVNRIDDTQMKLLETLELLAKNKHTIDDERCGIQSSPTPSKPIVDWG